LVQDVRKMYQFNTKMPQFLAKLGLR